MQQQQQQPPKGILKRFLESTPDQQPCKGSKKSVRIADDDSDSKATSLWDDLRVEPVFAAPEPTPYTEQNFNRWLFLLEMMMVYPDNLDGLVGKLSPKWSQSFFTVWLCENVVSDKPFEAYIPYVKLMVYQFDAIILNLRNPTLSEAAALDAATSFYDEFFKHFIIGHIMFDRGDIISRLQTHAMVYARPEIFGEITALWRVDATSEAEATSVDEATKAIYDSVLLTLPN
jgi:hypothetical protein